MSYYGYAGKLLDIDLTNGRTNIKPLDMNMAEKYIGGCGIAESVYWALGTCVTWSSGVPQIYSLRTLAELYTMVTGIEVTAEELKRKGERIWNLGKLLNTREGINRNDDKVPGQWATIPVNLSSSEGYLKDYFGQPVSQDDFESMLDDYYKEHGWDISTGVPARSKLAELGLEDLTGMLVS
jgi:aldehyde:ferredoxin oxidoreductase